MEIKTIFFNACANGDFDTIKKLDYGQINIYEQNHHAFHLACGSSLDVVKFLIELGEKNNQPIDIHDENEYAFQEACRVGKLDIIKYLISLELKYNPINIHAENECAFLLVCQLDDISIVKFLLSLELTHGRINIHVLNERALFIAVAFNNLELVEFLLEIGKNGFMNNNIYYEKYGAVNIYTKDDRDFTPFMVAVVRQNIDLAKFLIEYDKNHPSSNKLIEDINYLFIEACDRGIIKVIDFLVGIGKQYNLDIHYNCEEAIVQACRRRNLQVIKKIISLAPEYGKINYRHIYSCLIFSDFNIAMLIIRTNPEHDWSKTSKKNYQRFKEMISLYAENLCMLHRAFIDTKSDITDGNVVSVIKDYLFV